MRINRKLGAVLIAGMFMTTIAPTTSATSPKPCDDPVVGVYGIVTYIVLTIINRVGYGEAALENGKSTVTWTKVTPINTATRCPVVIVQWS